MRMPMNPFAFLFYTLCKFATGYEEPFFFFFPDTKDSIVVIILCLFLK